VFVQPYAEDLTDDSYPSPRGQASLSTKVASALADRLTSEPGATLKVRDLAAKALPHINPAYAVGRMLPPEQRTTAQAEAAALAETLIDELKAADVVVIAASMINFAPSSTLKAWIDHIVWPGRTMIPTKSGPEGLITGKKVYLVAASGGVYSSGPMAANDMLVPYLKQILGCIGITDIETIRAEAQSFGPEAAEKSAAAAMDQVAVVGKTVRVGVHA
jgi:FMN-dependent NADH-azoreductase